jgi:hypothetical protein
MKSNPFKQDKLAEKSNRNVTREMVHGRAAVLAANDGRPPKAVTMSDLAQAKRELMAGSDSSPKDAAIASPLSVDATVGPKAPVVPRKDEDDEGRSDVERFIQENIAEEEFNLMDRAFRTTT